MKSYRMLFPAVAGLLVSCYDYGGGYGYGPPGPGGWGPMMHYGFGYGGIFMWILFLLVIGLLVYFLVQARKGRETAGPPPESPLDILKKRYARGEITPEEFERMKKDLTG